MYFIPVADDLLAIQLKESKQIVIAGKSMFPLPSSPNLYATLLEVGQDLNLIMAVVLQYRKMVVKVNKLKTFKAKIRLSKKLWNFMDTLTR